MATPPNKQRGKGRPRGPLLVALGASLWATDGIFRSTVAAKDGPLVVVLLNHLLCLAVTLPALWTRRRMLLALDLRGWAALLVVSVFGSVVGSAAFTEAFATTHNYTVPILVQKLQPLVALVLARFFLGERTTRLFPLWAALALAGAYLVSFGWTNALTGLTAAEARPIGWALVAAAIWGATTVAGRALLAGRDFVFVTAARFTFGALAAGLVVAYEGTSALAVGRALAADPGPFAGMAFASGLLPLAVYYVGLAETSASVATLCELAFPLAAIVLNWWLLGSALTAPQLGGASLLLASITALSLGGEERPASPRAP